MIKLLIVDDEPIVRMGLSNVIDWPAHGIQIVGECSNGKKALQQAAVYHPDIVITDIRMPIMDGIELAKALKTAYSSIHVIMITGYNEQDDILDSLRIGVDDYLQKPVTAEKILNSVLKIKNDILLARQADQSFDYYEHFYEDNVMLAVNRAIQELLQNKISVEDVQRRFSAYRIHFNLEKSHLFGFVMENETIGGFLNVLDSRLKGMEYTVSYLDEKDLLLLWILDTAVHESDKIDELLTDSVKALNCSTRIILTYDQLITVDNLVQAIQSVIDASERNYLRDSMDTIIKIQNTDYPAFPEKEFDTLYSRLLHSTVNSDLYTQYQCVMKYMEMAEEYHLPHSRFCECFQLVIAVLKQGRLKSSEILQQLAEQHCKLNYNEILALIRQLYAKEAKTTDFTLEVYQFVETHLAEKLSTEDVANAMHMSTSYFCRCFKEQTGKTFIDWLNQKRVDVAKQLLRDENLKFYEIAQRVGFQDYKMLSKCFHRYAHMSLGEYRRQNHKLSRK